MDFPALSLGFEIFEDNSGVIWGDGCNGKRPFMFLMMIEF